MQIVLFQTIQFTMSTEFNSQKQFYFELFNLFKQFYFSSDVKKVLFQAIQFSISMQFKCKEQ